MRFNHTDHRPDSAGASVRYLDKAGETVLGVGDIVMLAAPQNWNRHERGHDWQPELVEGRTYRVSRLFADWVACLYEIDTDLGRVEDVWQPNRFTDVDTLETFDPVTEEEITQVLLSLGVEP